MFNIRSSAHCLPRIQETFLEPSLTVKAMRYLFIYVQNAKETEACMRNPQMHLCTSILLLQSTDPGVQLNEAFLILPRRYILLHYHKPKLATLSVIANKNSHLASQRNFGTLKQKCHSSLIWCQIMLVILPDYDI